MKESIRLRLEKMSDRFEEVGRLLTSVEVAGNSTRPVHGVCTLAAAGGALA
jgi:hypothetical protein